MNKTTLHLERPQSSQVRRADLAPATGYAMLADGRFKTEFLDQDAATKAALELLAKYPNSEDRDLRCSIEVTNAGEIAAAPQHA